MLLRFDKAKFKPVEREINGRKSKAVEYTVITLDNREKILTLPVIHTRKRWKIEGSMFPSHTDAQNLDQIVRSCNRPLDMRMHEVCRQPTDSTF
ncbi:MAG TPA: hypothetical protein VHF65_03390 [Nitrososphaera sp.]|jgi:hypothetical protein|nr:hypothetical protein [Nitrososphaera sp.]